MGKIETFISYFEKTRLAKRKVIEVIPNDKLNWSSMSNKITIGDLIRHIAFIERNVFGEIILGKKSKYKGCRNDLAEGCENIVCYFDEMHSQTIEILKNTNDESLKRKIKSLNGSEVEVGYFLRSLILHEKHHRAALCIYLNLLGVKTPQIVGLMEEQVIQLSK